MRKLFDQTKINQMELKNRFVRSATWEGMADDKGHLTDRLLKLYEDLAKGQVGLIITGYAFVLEDEQPNFAMMGIYDDSFIDDYKKLTDVVHSYGSKIALQIVYGGTQTRFNSDSRVIWGPSAVPEMGTGVVAKEMSKDEIKTLIKAFGDAAVRAKNAGFDGVQIHAAHGFLLSQFLNTYHNQRNDEYGGPIENRARIIFEIYDEIRNRVGNDYNVLIKINSADFVENGLVFEDSLYVCKELAKRGIDAIEVSGGISAAREQSFYRKNIDTPEKEAYFKNYAVQVAVETKVPIILVGGLRSLETMERILSETEIECFALSRPLISEPGLVKRWQEGDNIKTKCVSCNNCATSEGINCILNRK